MKNCKINYGFKADIWAAYAVGVTYYDLHLKNASKTILEPKKDKCKITNIEYSECQPVCGGKERV